jgi:S-adenosylmethionine:tRNA ribosyltransferase-isomerase
MKYSLSDFNFELPEELIAQYPLERRDSSRLFVVDRQDSSFTHDQFSNLSQYLRSGDLLVFNDSRVIPARIFFTRASGGVVEVVLVRRYDEYRWVVISNRSARLKIGETLRSISSPDITISILDRKDEYFDVETKQPFSEEVLNRIGKIPLPPYIRREPTVDDLSRYQTIYANRPGGVAAPTAGLHFTDESLSLLDQVGAERVFVTLDVSWGTFQPVRNEEIENHTMHTERYEISANAALRINTARNEGRRVIAVGTTSLRVLESSFKDGVNIAGVGETSIFIYPPYPVRSANALITNFHTPKSTLLMLVTAFAGYDLIMKAYQEAIREKYRFFSYGDSMIII